MTQQLSDFEQERMGECEKKFSYGDVTTVYLPPNTREIVKSFILETIRLQKQKIMEAIGEDRHYTDFGKRTGAIHYNKAKAEIRQKVGRM